MLLAVSLVCAGTAIASDTCRRPCGRQLTCGALNKSFACDELSGMGCTCAGCCLVALTPYSPPPPPADPPRLPPSPPPPSPGFPPFSPGGVLVSSTTGLREAITSASAPILLNLLPKIYPLEGSQINVSGVDVTLEGSEGQGDGTVIDAEALSRAFSVSDGGRLVLRHLSVINGIAPTGGCVLVRGAGASLRMHQASVRGCIATGNTLFEFGGGGLAVLEEANALLVDSTVADCTAPNTAVGGVCERAGVVCG